MAYGCYHIEQNRRAFGPLKVALTVLKFSLLILAFVLVARFQGKRTKEPDIYHTSDPSDNVRKGVQYTCGCGLPDPLQNAQSLSHESSQSTWNTCYDSSSVETVSVLMYPNFTGVELLEDTLIDVLSKKFNESLERKVVEGVNATVQAHDLAGIPVPKYSEDAIVKKLFPGGYIQQAWYVAVPKLVTGNGFWDFPDSHLVMTMTYRCSNCSSCALSAVNQIFTSISGDSDNKALWGQCVYWGEDNHCRGQNFYQAKCAMYPKIAPVPLVFGIQKFLQELLAMNGTFDLHPPSAASRTNYTTVTSNELHMSLRRDLPGMVELSFLEMEKGTSAWLSLLEQFPTLGTECSELNNVTTYNGSSVCNLYRSSRDGHFKVQCLDMTNQTQCQALNQGATIDEVPGSVWEFFNVSDWQSLMCPRYHSDQVPPYKMLSQTVPAMQDDLLNKVLQAKWFMDSWAQNSGVCMKTYADVIRYQPEKGIHATNATVQFMEAFCSANSSQSGYCWLSGRYRKLTDDPHEGWRSMDNASSRSSDTFVCYNIERESFGKWFIVTFGVLFSWLGTVDLIFKWIDQYLFGHRNEEQNHSAEGTTALGTPTNLEGARVGETNVGDHSAIECVPLRTGSSSHELNTVSPRDIGSAGPTPREFGRALSQPSYFKPNFSFS